MWENGAINSDTYMLTRKIEVLSNNSSFMDDLTCYFHVST